MKGAGRLPRGQALIMGGDQVYPDASREDYQNRMRQLYRFAFPDSDKPDADHPPVFLIPGNHDWYDGLTLFLAMFCSGRAKRLGSWRTIQHRSYFALRLPNNWWIWAYDSQLGEDIDAPQADYFVEVAKRMQGSPKVILCAPTPTWLKAELKANDSEQRDTYYRALHYMAYDILKVHCPDARVLAVLSGDLHHYSRYSASVAGAQFITAGGGGAFLHPTHHLKDKIEAAWVRQKQVLSLKTTPDADHKPSEREACYPARKESQRLALGNWKFPAINPRFCLTLGVIYWIAAQLLMFGSGAVFAETDGAGLLWAWNIAGSVLSSPLFWVLSLALFGALYVYTEAKPTWRKALHAITHGAVHIVLILLLVSVLPPFNAWLSAWSGIEAWWPGILEPGAIVHSVLFFFEVVLIGGFAGGFIWGLYLLLASYFGALHYNDAFSAMRLDRYKHFLRLRITRNELSIYPIALDGVPSRNGWRFNRLSRTNDQDQSVIVPTDPLYPHLIEDGPVVIRAPEVQRMTEVAKAQ